MHLAYLLIGSNLGDKTTYLKNAGSYIQQQCGQIVKQSSFYETEPWGFTEQPSFLNQALCIQTELAPAQLMHTLLQIESKMGRTRELKMGPRIIDLDILQIDQQIVDTPLLHLSKAEIIQQGLKLGVDYSLTVSCYQADLDGYACGKCDSCRLRREGFLAAGVADPTRYR
ncbi:MAG: 2-amino-4-hydroxy-6-hydroxymethyldihydropteridine diphosphokinase [Pseudomonadota bacterium]